MSSPLWSPSPIWLGEDAYVIGGGESLRNFSWGSIEGRNTVGCNSAFILGVDICKICIFGDTQWWSRIGKREGQKGQRPEEHLAAYGGLVVGCPAKPLVDKPDWVLLMGRYGRNGLSPGPNTLGFNGNTGMLALNLALILGAQRVFLLGFDMKITDEHDPNWHKVRYETGKRDSYPLFIRQFPPVLRDLTKVYPGREVWNVTDDSNLPGIPKISLAEHFGARKDGNS